MQAEQVLRMQQGLAFTKVQPKSKTCKGATG
jgi:hypothetical protein